MQTPVGILIVSVCVSVLACGHREPDRRRDSAAFQAGEVAHEVAKKSEKAVQAAGRELARSASEAQKGWKDAARRDREKGKK
jgi:hypothetical protein